jgi:F5/8 type C domain/PKD domain/Secretion system C-terminal sorting domain
METNFYYCMKKHYFTALCLLLVHLTFASNLISPPDCTLVPVVSAIATTGNAALAVDGNEGSRWESAFADPQSITLDFGTVSSVSAVTLIWETASAKDYFIRGSVDGETWVDLAEKTNMAYGARTDVIEGLTGEYRYIRMDGVTRTTPYGYSIYEFYVCGTPIVPFVGKHALFIGNSYTYYNDMPLMVESMAESTGDALQAESSAISGFSLEQHAVNAGTLGKIQLGGWDFVSIQEHSQRPALELSYVEEHTFPFAEDLVDATRQYSPCAEIFFYNTWGRKNGDAEYCPTIPEVCTYTGMDDRLQERYQQMADDNDAILSPVAQVRRQIRELHPEIELYDADQSHPTLVGSYVSALTFYTVILRKDPTLVTFNSTLNATVANQVKAIVKTVVFDDLLTWNVGAYDPAADFTYVLAGNTITFTNTSENGVDYVWDFGDGTTSGDENPEHEYAAAGTYTITLTTTNCNRESVSTQEVTIEETAGNTQFGKKNILVYPNPANDIVNIPAIDNGTVTLADMSGRNFTVKVNNHTADISKLASGCYIMQAVIEGATSNNMIIVE